MGVGALLAYARSLGIDMAPALAELGLADADRAGSVFSEPDGRVDVTVNDRLWRYAASHSGNAAFGLHFARRLDLDGFHVLGHLAMTSRSLGHAIDRIVHYSRLLHDAGRTEVEPREGGIALFPGCRGLPDAPIRHVAEFSAASVVVLARHITGVADLAPTAVCFQHVAPSDTAVHRDVFGVAPQFGAAETLIELDQAALMLPVRAKGPTSVQRYLESYAQTLLARLPAPSDDLASRVLRVTLSGLSATSFESAHRSSLEATAARLGMTARTMQRRLASEGTSYAAIIDDARRRWAIRCVGEQRVHLSELAYVLGFQDPVGFNRAFKRWTGTTPSAFRAHPSRTEEHAG